MDLYSYSFLTVHLTNKSQDSQGALKIPKTEYRTFLCANFDGKDQYNIFSVALKLVENRMLTPGHN